MNTWYILLLGDRCDSATEFRELGRTGIERNYTEFREWSALIPESDEGIPESDKVIPEFDEVIPESDSVHVWRNSGIDGTDSGGGTGSGMFNIAE